MDSFFSSLPKASEFFPPSPQAFKLLSTGFKWMPVVCSSFRVWDLHQKPDLFHVQCIHSAITHLAICTFVMLTSHPPIIRTMRPRILYTDSAPFSTARYSSMDSYE